MEFKIATFELHYEVGNFIKKGHYATVQYCTNIQSRDIFAAKMIKKIVTAQSSLENTTENIIREAGILKMMNHPNIIKIHDAFEMKDGAVLILELVTGGELFEHICSKGTLSEYEASKFINQILLGVNYIHSKNILHLDLKPENILVEDVSNQKIKIIDFGEAREIDEKPVRKLQGTLEFFAPEIVNSEPLSFATDIWSVGIITFIMLMGYSPFLGDSRNDTIYNITRCDLDLEEEPCSILSDLVKGFLKSMISKSPAARLNSEQCLDHGWMRNSELNSSISKIEAEDNRNEKTRKRHHYNNDKENNSCEEINVKKLKFNDDNERGQDLGARLKNAIDRQAKANNDRINAQGEILEELNRISQQMTSSRNRLKEILGAALLQNDDPEFRQKVLKIARAEKKGFQDSAEDITKLKKCHRHGIRSSKYRKSENKERDTKTTHEKETVGIVSEDKETI